MTFLTKALSKAQTAAIPFIRSAIAQGIKATPLYESLQAAGAGVRKTWLLDTYKSYAGIQQSGYAIQNVRHDYFPNYDKLSPSVTDTLRQYSVNVAISWRGKVAGDGVTKVYDSVWVTSNDKHTIQWYLDEAADYIATTEQYEDAEYIDPFILEAQQRNPLF